MCQYYIEIKNVLKVIINMGNSHTVTLSKKNKAPKCTNNTTPISKI